VADEALIPIGADSCELRFADDTWLQLERDTSGVARWAFRGFRPEQPDPVATGVLTHAGAEVFARLAASGTHKTGDEVGELSIPPRSKPSSSRAGGKAGKKSSGSRKRSPGKSSPSAPPSTSELPLNRLRELAAELKIEGRSKMDKAGLAKAIDAANKS
jgi:hypothetical protein